MRPPPPSRSPPTARASSPPRATSPSTHALYGLSGVVLRLGNVYGPRQDPLGEAGVIAIFCGKLARSEAPTVYGDGTPDPRLHICGRRGRRGARGRRQATQAAPFNVGTGRETSVLELVELLRGLA